MVNHWEPETKYELGSVVKYQGCCYKIVQPHKSQSDWTPPITPALWARLPETAPEQGQQQPQKDSYQGSSPHGEHTPWNLQHSQQVDIHHEEQKKHWYDLDDHRKKQLEIGGGLAAGLGLLAAGYYAYHEHEKSEEQKKAQVWGLQNWLRDAQARTEDYHKNGSRAPVMWALVHGRNIPQNAFPGGVENDQALFIARAFQDGGVHVGKACSRFQEGAIIGYQHKEIQLATYEVLITSDERAVKWVNARGHPKPNELGCTLVEGGHENDGTPLFIAQADINGGVHPGKASKVLDGAYIPYGGREVCVKEYRLLAYA